MSNNANIAGRKLYLDATRIFAILSVVMVHVSAYMVLSFPKTSESEFIIGGIFNGIFRLGGPTFLMISGALMLNEDRKFETKKFYRKALVRSALLLIGWLLAYGVFYAVILPISLGDAPSFDRFISYVLKFRGSRYPHLWYMFMFIGICLMTPVLRLFVTRKNRVYIFWIIVGFIFTQFLPGTLDVFTRENTFMTVSGFVGKFHLEPFTGYLGHILVGWYVSNFEMERKSRYLLYVAGIVAMIGSMIAVQFGIGEIRAIRVYVYAWLSLPSFIWSTATFVLIRQIFGNQTTASAWVKTVSDSCFGIYIVHVIFLELLTKIIIPYENTSCGPFIYILLSWFAVLALSLATVLLLGKIPCLRGAVYNR